MSSDVPPSDISSPSEEVVDNPVADDTEEHLTHGRRPGPSPTRQEPKAVIHATRHDLEFFYWALLFAGSFFAIPLQQGIVIQSNTKHPVLWLPRAELSESWRYNYSSRSDEGGYDTRLLLSESNLEDLSTRRKRSAARLIIRQIRK